MSYIKFYKTKTDQLEEQKYIIKVVQIPGLRQ